MKIITLPYVGENPILLLLRMFPDVQNTLPVVAIIANDTHLIIILIIPSLPIMALPPPDSTRQAAAQTTGYFIPLNFSQYFIVS
jgi:hypothetical protein